MTLRRAGFAAMIFLFGVMPGSALAEPTVIPLLVQRGSAGEARLGIDVHIGSQIVRVLLDTGSAGLRILASAVNDPTVHRTGTSAGGGYGSGLILHGESAIGSLGLDGLAQTERQSLELVDSFDCADAIPNCPAAHGGTPVMFGKLFPGILGIAIDDPPRGRCCANPLGSLHAVDGRYIVHASLSAPTMTVAPDPETVKLFTMLDLMRGLPARGCLHITVAVASDVCGDLLFDTGTPQLVVTTTGIAATQPTPPGTTATLTTGAFAHIFKTGPGTGIRLAMRRGPRNRIIVGLAALQDLDVFFDLAAHRIGLREI